MKISYAIEPFNWISASMFVTRFFFHVCVFVLVSSTILVGAHFIYINSNWKKLSNLWECVRFLLKKIMSVVVVHRKNECNTCFSWFSHFCMLFFHQFLLTIEISILNFQFYTDQTITWLLFEWSFRHDMGTVESLLGRIVRSMQSIITETSQEFNGKSTKIPG